MRKFTTLSAAALALALGGADAKAAAVDPHHAKMTHHVIHHTRASGPIFEGRAALTPVSPYGSWNGPVDLKSVGLSDNPDDCNNGCALSNGS